MLLVVNLDTNHVSDLVRRPNDPDVTAVARLLERGDVPLGLSYFHCAQLAAPSFREWSSLRALLENVRHVLLQPREDIFEEEAACAIAGVVGLHRRPPRVFGADLSEWGRRSGPAGYGAVEMIEYFREREKDRQSLFRLEHHFVGGSALKGKAYVIKNPLGPLTLMLQSHLADIRRTTPTYGGGLSAEQIVARSRGLKDFPAYEVAHVLTTYLLRNERVRARIGDLSDEYIASYAPYAAVSALDGPTAHRIREAKLECASRVTKRLADVLPILARVQAGELLPRPSA